jgi:sugar lactone lactonase YvrE
MKSIFFYAGIRIPVILIFAGIICLTACSDDDNATLPPEVTSISPNKGPKTTVIAIAGTNFSATPADNQVTFNGKAATVTAATSTQLTVTVPPSAGSGPVVVITKGKEANQKPVFEYEWIVSTVAGSTAGYVDGAAAKFNSPSGITVDANGNLFVTDYFNHMIRAINPNGMVSTLVGSTAGIEDGPAATAKFFLPNGAAVDKQGNIYVSEEGTSRIRKVTSAGLTSTFAGATPGYLDGVSTAAKFSTPSGIALDAEGTVYVADQFNNCIRKITPAGVVTTLAGSVTAGIADGTGAAAQFQRPVGVVVDEAGNVFVADLFNHRIRKITSDGVVTTIAGSTPGFADGTGTAAKFLYPAGLALDKEGNLFVADSENNRIRKITKAGVVTTFAGIGAQGTDNGLASTAQFYLPREIDIDAEGNIYVVEIGNHRIRKID